MTKSLATLLAIAALTGACSSNTPSATPAAPSPNESGSPGLVPQAFCELADSNGFRELAVTIKKGTELPDEVIARIDALITQVDASTGGEQASVSRFTDTLGQLKLAVHDAGDQYPYDRGVTLRLKSFQYTGLTAMLDAGCTP